ncbi:MAG: IgA Peptidase M64 [Rikenellaceae bacterium]|nr:IgA Peptidase M64 [Rikenellaceae bacterium]
MKRFVITLLASACIGTTLHAQRFDDHFRDTTLRVDYIFSGDAGRQSIHFDRAAATPVWAGRRHNLAALPLQGNGQVEMRDARTGEILYASSFSSLFQEWLTTDEATQLSKAFENSFLLPMPRSEATVKVTLLDTRGRECASLTHRIDPDDILIRRGGTGRIAPHRYLLRSDDCRRAIDVAIVAEGYTEAEAERFYADAQSACDHIFAHEPFASYRDRFNVVAVAAPSADSGVSVPRDGIWRSTAVGSHFDTFYSDRYLTTGDVHRLHTLLEGIPYEHIVILANTDTYGGGGIYNSYTLTTAHHPQFAPVVVHEFGHSFGGLADEYYYENDVMSDTYPTDTEPWEQNITTLKDFASKWQDMLAPGTPVPTPAADTLEVAVYEGAAYSFKGLYRPAHDCRMHTNSAPGFCPVCRRAIERLIVFYTEEKKQ